MQKINSEKSLKQAILELEEKRAYEEILVREQFQLAYESIKPINLIKSAFNEVASSEGLKDDIINSTIGMTAGYLSKKLFEGITNSPFKKIIGTALMFGIKNVIAKNPETVRSVVHGFFKIIRKKLDKFNETDNDETK